MKVKFLINPKWIQLVKKILFTIDDGFSSFYEKAWPYLKEKQIPFILFISTESIGKNGYMNWDEIKEIERESFAFIGNHSHSHDYLLDLSFDLFKADIIKSVKIFKDNLGYNPIFFSYPFGEFSNKQISFIKIGGFELGFCCFDLYPMVNIVYPYLISLW